MPDPTVHHDLDVLRASLSEKVGELHRRVTHAKQVLSPSTWWHNPWVRIGIGVAVGLALLSRRKSDAHEGLVHAMVRSGLSAAVAALVTRQLALPAGDS